METTGKVMDIGIDYASQKCCIRFMLDYYTTSELDKIKDIESLDIKAVKHREKRSSYANAYMWLLLQKMAVALNTTKDELYLQMLDRYGVFTFVLVKPSVASRVKQEWRTVREIGEVSVNGTTGIQLQCFFGSSTYNTKEMSVLIDGVVSECKELGIETLPPHELERMKVAWNA